MKQHTTQLLKFKKLKRRLKLPEWQLVGLLECIWKCARDNAPDGDIGKLSNEDIAAAIEWDDDPDTLVCSLIEYGWLDEDPEFRLVVHDWSDHVPTYMKGNYKQHAKRFANEVAKDRPKEVAKDGAKDIPYDPPTKPNQTKPNLSFSSETDEACESRKSNEDQVLEDRSGSHLVASESRPKAPTSTDGRAEKSEGVAGGGVSTDEVVEVWNRSGSTTKVRLLTAERRKKLLTRLRDPTWPWRQAIAKLPIENTERFVWQPDFDWLIANATNAVKLVEGKFDRKEIPKSGGRPTNVRELRRC